MLQYYKRWSIELHTKSAMSSNDINKSYLHGWIQVPLKSSTEGGAGWVIPGK
jgi:hypothetical protein